jgi:hypothetical protein
MVDEMGGVDEVNDPAGAVHFHFLGDSYISGNRLYGVVLTGCGQ